MNPLANEWISKAEGDFNTAQRELAAEEMPNYYLVPTVLRGNEKAVVA